jgi:hypothetical protein
MARETKLAPTGRAVAVPTVHLNGSAGSNLLAGIERAATEVHGAILALAEAGPNMRDYYPQGPDAYSVAAEEHAARLRSLSDVHGELMTLWEAVSDQVDAATMARGRR